MGDVKFAVVRVQGEQRMIDLFTLLVSNGYSDVSFVSSLANTILKTDASAAQEDASASRVVSSSSSNGASCSSGSSVAAAPAAVVSTTTSAPQQSQPQPPPPPAPVQQPQPKVQQPQQPQHDQGRERREEESPLSSPDKAAHAANLLQSLFDRGAEEDEHAQFVAAHQQPWILPTGEIPAPMMHGQPPIMMTPIGLMGPSGSFGVPCQMSNRSLHYAGVDGTGRKMPFNVRMKGWQRKILSEAMAAGIPTGAELAALCERSQVTEIQAIRFFRKRKYGVTGDGTYQMDDDVDGMRGDSPDDSKYPKSPEAQGFLQQQPKIEDIE